MRRFFTLKNSFILFLSVLTLFSALVLGALENLTRTIEHLKKTESNRIHATGLATEYKSHVQALMLNAMAFVSTEQPEFEENYNYYTDLIQGKKTGPDGSSIALMEKFRRADFNKDEMATLTSAYKKTLELAKIEVEAMNTAKGLFDDGNHGLKIGLPDPLLAKVMLFGQQYSNAAAQIGRDIDDFNIMQSNRYNAQVDSASAASQRAYQIAITTLLVQLICCAVALFTLFRSIKKPLDQGVQIAQRLALGDLTASAVVTRRDELGSLLLALNGIGLGIQNVIGEVRDRTEEMACASRVLSEGNTDLSQRTFGQAASLQETSVAMDQIATTVQQNADNAHQALDLVLQATACTIRGNDVVKKAVDNMQTLQQRSKKMANIVEVINSIAFQTNILALNAAVEAARSGPHGRGFAVVATEVRTLAQRSAASAQEIETLISQSLLHMETGGQLVDSTGKAMQEIAVSVKKVNDIMTEIATASQQQASGIQQVTLAVGKMDANTRQNAKLVQQAASATLDQQEHATRLELAVARFKLRAAATTQLCPAT